MEIGQKLWFQPSKTVTGHTDGCYVTVHKVGRKWITLADNRGRFDIETMLIDGKGYSSPGKVYYSKELYEEELNRVTLWNQLAACLQYYGPPPGINTQELKTMVAKLQTANKERSV